MDLGVPPHPERRGGFGAEAARYHRIRPRYPTSLFDAVAAYGALSPEARVLEVGAGTGIATGPMLDRGWRVIAVELDPAMAAMLRGRFPAVPVTVAAFEDVRPPADLVDLVLCATAFHWLDPGRRVDLVARTLHPGGTAAVIWTRHVAGGSRAFFDAAEDCYARSGEAVRPLPDEAALESHAGEFEQSTAFMDVERTVLTQEIAYRTDDFVDLLRTFSDTAALEPQRREALLGCIGTLLERDFGGWVVKRYAFELVLARRR